MRGGKIGCVAVLIIAVIIFIALEFWWLILIAIVIIVISVIANNARKTISPQKVAYGGAGIGGGFIRDNSERFARLLKLNAENEKYTTSLREEEVLHLDSLQKFRLFKPEKALVDLVQSDYGYYVNLLEGVSLRKKIYNKYESAYSEIMNTEVCVPENLPFYLTDKSYCSKEKKLVSNPISKLRIQEGLTIAIMWEYTSPAGRNHYENINCFTESDIKRLIDEGYEDNKEYWFAHTKLKSANVSEENSDIGSASDGGDTSYTDMPKCYSELKRYRSKVEFHDDINECTHLIEIYQEKQKILRELIEKRFPPPQMAYDKFTVELNEWESMFFRNIERTIDIIGLASERTEKVNAELFKAKKIQTIIMKKMEELAIEFAVSVSESQEDPVVGTIEELMQNMINAVKKYE